MQWEFIVALAIAIPIILFPAAFVWYLNIGGIYHAIQEARKRRAAREERAGAVAEVEQHVATTAAKEEPVGTRR
ncbi:hypothetical protein ACFLVA_01695 [Chloroflexota bacterium]